jgi:hypothetical protein
MKEEYPDFRTLMNNHMRRDIEEVMNYYEDNQDITCAELLNEFPMFNEMEVEIILRIFKEETKDI